MRYFIIKICVRAEFAIIMKLYNYVSKYNGEPPHRRTFVFFFNIETRDRDIAFTYTTRPFYVVQQSFVDKFRASELRSTNSKDEP